MKYVGSKRRIAKDILPIILKNRKVGQYYVEPFCGGCNTLDKVENPRIGNDINFYQISLLKALQEGWMPPSSMSESYYYHIRTHMYDYDPEMVGFASTQLSYGGKWWGGYARDSAGKRNYCLEAYKNITKQTPNLKDIHFTSLDYRHLNIPPSSIVYCDIPYSHSLQYKDKFDHAEFWDWAREIAKSHDLFVSEYEAPSDFECIWEKRINNTLVKNTGSKQGTERLFVYKGQ